MLICFFWACARYYCTSISRLSRLSENILGVSERQERGAGVYGGVGGGGGGMYSCTRDNACMPLSSSTLSASHPKRKSRDGVTLYACRGFSAGPGYVAQKTITSCCQLSHRPCVADRIAEPQMPWVRRTPIPGYTCCSRRPNASHIQRGVTVILQVQQVHTAGGGRGGF